MQMLGKKIKMLRKNKGMTQEQLAEILSVSPQTVSKWENNVSVPDIELLPILARYFGITMDELFNYRLDALNYKERFVKFMADNGVLRFGEFQLKSGRSSPYYIETANYKSGVQIAKLGEFYAESIREYGIETNLLIGNTEKEIPIIISASMILYEKYGVDIHYSIKNAVGKKADVSDKMVLIQDTLTSGNTLRETFRKLQSEGVQGIPDVIVSVDRMERGEKSGETAREAIEKEFGVSIYAIVTLDDIIHAVENGVIAGMEYLERLKEYREKYGKSSHYRM